MQMDTHILRYVRKARVQGRGASANNGTAYWIGAAELRDHFRETLPNLSTEAISKTLLNMRDAGKILTLSGGRIAFPVRALWEV